MADHATSVHRGAIVARIKPGSRDAVARIFAESDSTELPRLARVRHRSLFAYGDVYIHVVEFEGPVDEAIGRVTDHPLFREVSARLDPHIEPYDPATWRSPKDAMAEEFYAWDA